MKYRVVLEFEWRCPKTGKAIRGVPGKEVECECEMPEALRLFLLDTHMLPIVEDKKAGK